MWDDALVTRVRDRKLNEIMVFASMAKIDSSNVDAYIDIIVSLGDDIDACDTLLDTNGEAEIELEPIDAPEYLARLSPSEKADEDAFNAMKTAPGGDVPAEAVEDYVRRLIADAVEDLKAGGADSDALEAMKGELASCRSRIETLSQQLEYAETEKSTLDDELKEANENLDRISDQNDQLRAQVSSLKAELTLANQKLSVLEPAYQELSERVSAAEASKAEPAEPIVQDIGEEAEQAVESAEAAVEQAEETENRAETPEEVIESAEQAESEAVAEESEAEQAVESAGYMSPENVDVIYRVREMKDRKIDEFIEAEENGSVTMDVSDDIVSFLKTDVAICDAILAIDFSSRDSVVSGFRRIIDIVSESTDPQHQDEYVASLTPDEAQLEYAYSRALNSLQGMMMYMRDDISEE